MMDKEIKAGFWGNSVALLLYFSDNKLKSNIKLIKRTNMQTNQNLMGIKYKTFETIRTNILVSLSYKD
jgi:hypothetical protein